MTVTAAFDHCGRGCRGSSPLEQDPQIRLEQGQHPPRPEDGSATAEVDGVVARQVEGVFSARVPAGPYPQSVMSGLERNLDGLTVLDRTSVLAVHRELKHTAPELNAGSFPRHPECC